MATMPPMEYTLEKFPLYTRQTNSTSTEFQERAWHQDLRNQFCACSHLLTTEEKASFFQMAKWLRKTATMNKIHSHNCSRLDRLLWRHIAGVRLMYGDKFQPSTVFYKKAQEAYPHANLYTPWPNIEKHTGVKLDAPPKQREIATAENMEIDFSVPRGTDVFGGPLDQLLPSSNSCLITAGQSVAGTVAETTSYSKEMTTLAMVNSSDLSNSPSFKRRVEDLLSEPNIKRRRRSASPTDQATTAELKQSLDQYVVQSEDNHNEIQRLKDQIQDLQETVIMLVQAIKELRD